MISRPEKLITSFVGLAFLLAAAAVQASDRQLRWDNVERVVAFGDVHGAYEQLVDLLQDAGVLDEDLHWSGGATHFSHELP